MLQAPRVFEGWEREGRIRGRAKSWLLLLLFLLFFFFSLERLVLGLGGSPAGRSRALLLPECCTC